MLAAQFSDESVRDDEKPYLNDLLYIYKKLKENSNGLNYDMIAAYEKKHPKSKITECLAKMDKWLEMPEAERFAPVATSKAQSASKKEKQGLSEQLSGTGKKRSFFGYILGEKAASKKG